MVGVAVKVTDVPAQIVVADAPMLTLAGKAEFTIMLIAFEVAGLPVGQVALEVRPHVTICPLVSVEVV